MSATHTKPHVLSVYVLLYIYSTNHADIKSSRGQTAAGVARDEGYHALADYVEGFQPGPRGELAISCWSQ